MASSGKKGKKSKGKTVPLTDFLQETTGLPTLPVKKFNWSDDVEESCDGYDSRPKPPVALPTAPRAARGPDMSEDSIPMQGPFIAYISNLPYDVEEVDISAFFTNMSISNIRLPRDDRSGDGGKSKGFGYVEFDDRSSLIEAISIIDTNLKGRRIKIDVASSADNDRRRGGSRMDMGRDRPERPEVTMTDWRSGPRDQPTSETRDRGGFNRDNRDNRDRDREGPSDSNRPGAWRDSQDRPSFRDDDRRGYRDSDRGGYNRDNYDRGGDRYRDSDRGGDRYRDSDRDRGFSDRERDRGFSDRGRYGDRDRDDRRGFGSRRNYGDREERRDDFRREERKDDDRERDQPKSRPKLNLQPRTKPIENPPPEQEKERVIEKEPAPQPVPSASIFGSAKPVDTAAREREIEARLAKEKESKASKDGKDSNFAPQPVPSASIFGSAKPVDTAAREREIEARLAKEKESKATKDGKDSKSRESDEERGKKDWSRRRNNDHEDRSPERRQSSRGPPPKRSEDRRDDRRVDKRDDRRRDDDRRGDKREGDKKGGERKDRAPPKREEKPKDRPPRDNHEKEMPKLKEPEPPNFAASNKFATLEADNSSD